MLEIVEKHLFEVAVVEISSNDLNSIRVGVFMAKNIRKYMKCCCAVGMWLSVDSNRDNRREFPRQVVGLALDRQAFQVR